MPVYLVDRDLPGVSSEALETLHQTATMACWQATSAGQAIHYLHSTFIPGEQRCLCLFEADDESRRCGSQQGSRVTLHARRHSTGVHTGRGGQHNRPLGRSRMTPRPFRFAANVASANHVKIGSDRPKNRGDGI